MADDSVSASIIIDAPAEVISKVLASVPKLSSGMRSGARTGSVYCQGNPGRERPCQWFRHRATRDFIDELQGRAVL